MLSPPGRMATSGSPRSLARLGASPLLAPLLKFHFRRQTAMLRILPPDRMATSGIRTLPGTRLGVSPLLAPSPNFRSRLRRAGLTGLLLGPMAISGLLRRLVARLGASPLLGPSPNSRSRQQTVQKAVVPWKLPPDRMAISGFL